MHDHLIHLGFSERVALANASAELARHRTTLREQAALLRQSGRNSEQRTGVIVKSIVAASVVHIGPGFQLVAM
mgnify:CR=1 FL=1